MNNDTYTPCTKCGRPMRYCKGNCCQPPRGCECQEYGCKHNACIRPGQPECPYTAVIPAVNIETIDGIEDLADCFAHVVNLNTTFYIDDKHRIMTIWAGPVEMEIPEDITSDEQFIAYLIANETGFRSQHVYFRVVDGDTGDRVIWPIYYDRNGIPYYEEPFYEVKEQII